MGRFLTSIGQKLSKEELDSMLVEIDQDGDGCINCVSTFSRNAVPEMLTSSIIDVEFVRLMIQE